MEREFDDELAGPIWNEGRSCSGTWESPAHSYLSDHPPTPSAGIDFLPLPYGSV